ncbi:MAG: replication initiator protein [Microvirus sp.]|nr:MAG: replication initiator protein [Microvirus sp.]
MAKCVAPFPWIDKSTGESITLPCGKCYPCLSRRASGWSYRLMKEERISSSSYFITFTYDDEHVPRTDNNFKTLYKRHLQLFFKKLRKLHPPRCIKYFCAGEYGTSSYRPHYHAILFNLDLSKLLNKRDAYFIKTRQIILDGKSPFHSQLWPHGHITIGLTTAASVGYTLKYMMKESRIPLHKNDDRVPEFQLQSKGLGKSHLSDNMIAWHESDILNRMYIPLSDGKKIAMPRYYKNKLYTKEQRQHIGHYLSTHIVDKIDLTAKQQLNNFEHSQIKINKSRLNEKL